MRCNWRSESRRGARPLESIARTGGSSSPSGRARPRRPAPPSPPIWQCAVRVARRARATYAVRGCAVARADEITSYLRHSGPARASATFAFDSAIRVASTGRRERERDINLYGRKRDREGEVQTPGASSLTHVARCFPAWLIRCPIGWGRSPRTAARRRTSRRSPPRKSKAPWISRKRTTPGTPSRVICHNLQYRCSETASPLTRLCAWHLFFRSSR